MDAANLASFSQFGQLFGIPGQIASTFMQNKANQKATQENRDWELKMWQMQNEYNTPLAQMDRLKKAGLNPNLVYGSGSASTGNNSSTPAPSSPVSYTAPSVHVPDIMDAISKLQAIKLMNENLSKAQYETGITKEAYKKANLENEFIFGTGKGNANINPLGNGLFAWTTQDAVGQSKPFYLLNQENELAKQRAGIQGQLLGNKMTAKNLQWIDLINKSNVDQTQLGNILKGQEANLKGELNRWNATSSDWFLVRLGAAMLNKLVDAAEPSGRRDYVQRY